MAHFSKDSEPSQEVMLDVSAIEHDGAQSKHPAGHVLLLRTVLGDGFRCEFALNRTECAQLYIRFRDDMDVLRWAAMLEQRADLVDHAPSSSGSH